MFWLQRGNFSPLSSGVLSPPASPYPGFRTWVLVLHKLPVMFSMCISLLCSREREELLLDCVAMPGAFCRVHEASITVRKSSLAVGSGRADFDSCLNPHVLKQSQGKRFPAALQDVLHYGTLKPQARVLRLGNTWLRYNSSHVGWSQGRSSASLNLVSLHPAQHPAWDIPQLPLRSFFFPLMPARCGQNTSTVLGSRSEKDFWTWLCMGWLAWLPGAVGCRAGTVQCWLVWGCLARLYFLPLIFHLCLQRGLLMSISPKHHLSQWYPVHSMHSKAGMSGPLRSLLPKDVPPQAPLVSPDAS